VTLRIFQDVTLRIFFLTLRIFIFMDLILTIREGRSSKMAGIQVGVSGKRKAFLSCNEN